MNPNSKTTINEVARRAGVSKGTISKVLNNKPGVKTETRKRVLTLVDQMEYHPNSVAQALAYNRTGNIGLIIPHEAANSLNGTFWSTLIKEIAQRACQDNYYLMLFTPRKEQALEAMYEEILNSPRVDGFIIGAEQVEKKGMSRLLMKKIPFVLIGKNKHFSHLHVDVDSVSATEMAVNHLIGHGFRKIGMIAGPSIYSYNEERILSYQSCMIKNGLNPIIGMANEYNNHEAGKAVREALKKLPDLDSLFIGAGGDFMFDTLNHIKEQGINPNDMGIVTFDDYHYLDFVDPKLTAVNQPLDQLGIKATEMLLRQILKKKEPQENIILKASLNIRSSCGEKI